MFRKNNKTNLPEEPVVLTNEEREEFNAFLFKVYRPLYFTIKRIVKDEELAQDILQETVITAYKKFHQLQDKNKFEGWITKIAKNKCADEIKKLKITNENDIQRDRIEYVGDISCEIAAEFDMPVSMSSENESIINEVKTEIRNQIMNMSYLHRKILYLYYYNDISLTEIASNLDLNYNTVVSNHSRALKILESKLNKQEAAYFMQIVSEDRGRLR